MDERDEMTSEECREVFRRLFPGGLQDPAILDALAPITECAELLGMCVWDVFSDNHTVTAGDGRRVNLGSFRSAAVFISDFFDGETSDDADLGFGRHARFYLGTTLSTGLPNLSIVYELIFRRMQLCDMDWRYAQPQLCVTNFGEEENDELDAVRAGVREANYESVRNAQEEPPPVIVMAYRDVYGTWPEGWPPRIADVL